MGFDFKRHQQPVGGPPVRTGGMRGRWLVYAVPLACATVALGAIALPRRAPSVPAEGGASANGASSQGMWSGLPGEGEKGPGLTLDALSGLMAQDSHVSSVRTFLADLSAADRGASATWAVEWDTREALPVAAKEALDRYAAAGGASLVMSGYVDLAGDVWCALVQGGAEWCDLVLTSAREGDQSTVRVVRMWPEGAA